MTIFPRLRATMLCKNWPRWLYWLTSLSYWLGGNNLSEGLTIFSRSPACGGLLSGWRASDDGHIFPVLTPWNTCSGKIDWKVITTRWIVSPIFFLFFVAQRRPHDTWRRTRRTRTSPQTWSWRGQTVTSLLGWDVLYFLNWKIYPTWALYHSNCVGFNYHKLQP